MTQKGNKKVSNALETLEKNKRGRPTLYSDEMAKIICEVIAGGATAKDAFGSVGIKASTYESWYRDKKEFAAMVNQARARGRKFIVNCLVEQIKKGSTAATIFWLKNRDRENWQDNPELPIGGGQQVIINFNIPRPQHQIIDVKATSTNQLPRPTHGVQLAAAKA